MNFDYLQTQAEVTFQLVGKGNWVFKKVSILGLIDTNSGPENEAFNAHQASMIDAGWALVSLAAIPGKLKQPSSAPDERSQTKQYDLSWKRLKDTSTVV